MSDVFFSAFPGEEHARTMLDVVRRAGVAARLVRTADLPPDRLPDWCSEPQKYACFMLVQADQKEAAEIATHKFYGLCRWCGRRLKGQASGNCPACGTPVDDPRRR